MLEVYTYHGKERLRCGYTTGSCAAAAARAAAEMLLSGREVTAVELLTPKGIRLTLPIEATCMETEAVSCAVRKDGGDDPDITHGLLIFAKAERIGQGVEIAGGTGVGRVTAPGLDQPVGAAAINSVPRRMIMEAVEGVMEQYAWQGGIRITISVPEGEAIAAKTFNPRLGIVGGISIIGTTGIVEPMSNRALVETIRVEANMRREKGEQHLLLTLGNYGSSFLAQELPDIWGKSVMCSNFIGDAIDIALELGFASVLIVGHVAKLVKLGAGIMNTHSGCADGRMEVLVTCGVLAGARLEVLRKIPDCVAVDAALELLEGEGVLPAAEQILLEKIEGHLHHKVHGEIPIGAVLFSNRYGIIGKTKEADRLIRQLIEER